ncbi:MAG: Asp23/Gls24 family envelope stress response protein [Lachnospiraceae bacterium]|nr:Asp23/Gls24 family envelope stress response protein [Lachnospiraceae bacterium]
MEEIRNTHIIHEDGKIGEVQIADDVVAIIAGLAATEVDGVADMYGNITKELVSKLGMKSLSKGVKAFVTEEGVVVELALNIKFGYKIKEVSVKVQEKVKSAIETMTGLDVVCVNVRIANITIEQN